MPRSSRSGHLLLAILVTGTVAVGGCASDSSDATRSVDVVAPAVPGPGSELPTAAGMGAPWVPGEGRLPQGINLEARNPSDAEAMFAVTEPFGRRPMPPGSEGIESHALEAPPGELRVLVTYPTFHDSMLWGEQFLLVLDEDGDGWFLREAWFRELCLHGTETERC